MLITFGKQVTIMPRINKIKYKKGPLKLLRRQTDQLKGLTPKKVF